MMFVIRREFVDDFVELGEGVLKRATQSGLKHPLDGILAGHAGEVGAGVERVVNVEGDEAEWLLRGHRADAPLRRRSILTQRRKGAKEKWVIGGPSYG